MAARLPALLIAAMVALALLVGWLALRGGEQRTLTVEFDSATMLIPGLDVRLDGLRVGRVDTVDQRGGRAIVRLEIEADRAWPLHRGTRAALRLTSLLGYANRYVALDPGPPTEAALADGATIDEARSSTPVEFDELLGTFDRRTRRGLGRLAERSAATLRGRERGLARGLDAAPPAFGATAGLLGELGADRAALAELVDSGAATATTLARHGGRIGQLVDGLATTLDAVAGRSTELRAALADLAPTLRTARGTLARVDATLPPLDGLVADVRPGARQLAPLAASARPALDRLLTVGPPLRETLRATDAALPPLSGLLDEGTPVARQLTRLLPRLEPLVHCVAPYVPDVAGFASIWGVGASKNYDAQGHYIRTQTTVSPFSVATGQQTAEGVAALPGITYAFPRPPGLNAGRPQLMPECGVGPDALDPSKDPEARG